MKDRKTILERLEGKGKFHSTVFTIVAFGLCFCVADMGFIENAEGIGALGVIIIGAIGVITGIAAGWSINEWLSSNAAGMYDGGVGNSNIAYEKTLAQMNKWEVQYAQTNNDQFNAINTFDATTLDYVRKCENEVPQVLSYDIWEEARYNMDCFEDFNSTMTSIAVNIMGNYGAIDMDVIAEMRIADLLVYSNVYQPAGNGNPTSNPDEWVGIETISYGIEYAGNFDINADYKLGEYYLNYVYVPSNQKVTIGGLDYDGGTSGEIFNFATFTEIGIIPTYYNVSYVESKDVYINGIYKNSFGPNTFGDISQYNQDYNGVGLYDKICVRDTLTFPTNPDNCGTQFQNLYFYEYSSAISTNDLYLDVWFTYADMPNIDTEIGNVYIYIDVDNDTSYDITKTINPNATNSNIRNTFKYNYQNYPAIFNPTLDTSQIRISASIEGTTNDLFTLKYGLRNSTDIGKDNLFFRREYNNPVGIHFPATTYSPPILKIESIMPSKNLDEYNRWQAVMDDIFTAMDNSAFSLWSYHKILGRNSAEDVPASELTLYPDFGFSNINSLSKINRSEALFIYYAMINQLFEQFEEFGNLYNLSLLDTEVLNISNFNDYAFRLNATHGLEEIPESWYWISPLKDDLYLENNTCYINDQPLLIMDLINETFYTLYKNDYYCIKGIMSYGEYVENATLTIQKVEEYTTKTYGFSLDELGEQLFPWSTNNLLWYAGISVAIGVGIMIFASVSERFSGFKIIGQIALIIGILIAIYWGVSEFVFPWLVNIWETLSQWWDTIIFWD